MTQSNLHLPNCEDISYNVAINFMKYSYYSLLKEFNIICGDLLFIYT